MKTIVLISCVSRKLPHKAKASIFRKNIGRAILSRDHDPFLEQWEFDLTASEAKRRYAPSLDFIKQRQVENQVSEYIRKNLCCVVFQVENKEKRFEWESKIISRVSLCTECGPSPTWLGNYSPKDKIRRSGLWSVNELYKTPITDSDLTVLKMMCCSKLGKLDAP